VKVLEFEELPSTNDYLKELPFSPYLAVVALSQTRGRGRRGKSWLSKRGKGLYFSVMLPPLGSVSPTLASLAFGYAVYKGLSELSPRFYLKWPNDVYVKGKKVAGILPELLKDRLIVGVGVNLTYTKEELSGMDAPATSLLEEGILVERRKLLELLLLNIKEVDSMLRGLKFTPSLFERACPLIGKTVRIIEGEKVYNALALGIDRDGALIVEVEGKIKRLFSAQVSVREEEIGNG